MSETEIIVKMDKHIKIKGGTYKQDLIRCEDCRFYEAINNSDRGRCKCMFPIDELYPDDFCSYGEKL